MLAEDLLTGLRIGLEQEQIGGGDTAGLELRQQQGERDEDEAAHDPDRARRRSHPTGDPAPEAVGLFEVLMVEAGLVLRPRGPERDPTEQDKCGGQECHGRDERRCDTDRGDGAEPAVGVQVGQQEAQHAEDDGARGGRDGFERCAPGDAHRGVLVFLETQFLRKRETSSSA